MMKSIKNCKQLAIAVNAPAADRQPVNEQTGDDQVATNLPDSFLVDPREASEVAAHLQGPLKIEIPTENPVKLSSTSNHGDTPSSKGNEGSIPRHFPTHDVEILKSNDAKKFTEGSERVNAGAEMYVHLMGLSFN
jgi:hypothetical protein